MRLIGQVTSSEQAQRFSAFLVTKEIATQCDETANGWDVWVRDEDRVDEANQLLEVFLRNPEDDQYRQAVDQAQRIAKEEADKRILAKKNMVQMNHQWNAPLTKRAPTTIAIVVICSIVALLTDFGKSYQGSTYQALALTSVTQEQAIDLVGMETLRSNGNHDSKLRLGSLWLGQVWRAVTPIFIHHGAFHLVFNMYWLILLGGRIESRYGALWLLFIVCLSGACGNIAQGLAPVDLGGSAVQHVATNLWMILLGGFSGANYGLLGYIWMKMTFSPQSGLAVPQSTLMILIGWLLFCMSPLYSSVMGPNNIANWAHGVGLLAGLAIGYTPKLLSDLGIGKAGKAS